MIANPDNGPRAEGDLKPPADGPDSSFDFRWIPEPQQTPHAASFGSAGTATTAPPMGREVAEGRIVIALTIACTVMALLDLFLLASGL